MSIKIMSHLVAGFPDRAGFSQAVKGLKEGGADILELQIPFSDPIADGPVITNACEQAIARGFKVKQIFDYIDMARQAGFERIVVMTYANIAFHYGIPRYVADLKSAGVEAVLIPDLPLEDEEGFFHCAFGAGLAPMPVVVVNMPEERLVLLRSLPFQKVYAAIRTGITGKETVITDQVKTFLDGLSEYERYAGFGIRSQAQIRMLAPHADVAVVGSYFTRVIHDAHAHRQDIFLSVKSAMAQLI